MRHTHRSQGFRRLLTISVIAIAALAASACAGGRVGSDGGAASSESNVQTIESPVQPAQAPNQSKVSPLAEYLSAIEGTDLSPDSQIRRFLEEQNRREELIAQCMHEAGFEYVPSPQAMSAVQQLGEWQTDDQEWVLQFGYGIFQRPEGGQGWSAEWSVLADPNSEYVESLSDGERSAFFEALHGPSTGVADETVMEFRGCRGWAQQQVFLESPGSLHLLDEFAPLFEAIDTMRENLLFEISDADADWAACMADAGHPGFQRQRDAQQSITERINVLMEGLGDWDWLLLGEPSPDNHPAFADAAEHETALALADLNCRVTVDFNARQEARNFEAETQFVNDHRAALEALRSAAEQRS